MRAAALLPLSLAFAFAVPAHAQTHGITGIHIGVGSVGGPSLGPITGYGPDQFNSAGGGMYQDMAKAQRLIGDGQYQQADDLLATLVGRTSNRQVRFLKGVAKLGMGDAAAARRYFERSIAYGRNGSPGVMSGLALAEIRLGNRDAAHSILDRLRTQKEKCGGDCSRAVPLDQAVSVIEKALA